MTNKYHIAIVGVFGLVALTSVFSSRPAKVSAQNTSQDPTMPRTRRLADEES